jgi:hypothetical protein
MHKDSFKSRPRIVSRFFPKPNLFSQALSGTEVFLHNGIECTDWMHELIRAWGAMQRLCIGKVTKKQLCDFHYECRLHFLDKRQQIDFSNSIISSTLGCNAYGFVL